MPVDPAHPGHDHRPADAPPRRPRIGNAFAAMTHSLRYRNYRLFFSGQLISLVGTWMQNVAEAWLVYTLTGSSAALGLVRFAALAPVFVLGLVGGDWADRANRRTILVITQASAMVLAFILAGLTLTGVIEVWHLVVLAGCLGLVNALDVPARQSFVVDLVEDKADLPNAIGLNSSMFHLARVLGPSLAGVLLALVGAGWCFVINGASFAVVIAGLLMMRLPARARVRQTTPMLQRIRRGLGYAWNAPDVRSTLGLIALLSFFGTAYLVLMPVFAKEVLGSDAGGYGMLMTATGAGSLLGALTLTMRRGTTGMWRVRFTAGLGFGLALCCFAASRHLYLSMALLVPVGFFMVLFMATSNTLLQVLTPDELRGRVMALFSMMFMGMAPFGALTAGLAAEEVGAGWTVGVGGAACVLAVLAIGRPGRRGLQQEENAPHKA